MNGAGHRGREGGDKKEGGRGGKEGELEGERGRVTEIDTNEDRADRSTASLPPSHSSRRSWCGAAQDSVYLGVADQSHFKRTNTGPEIIIPIRMK